jgi:uncharacterized protein (TIGR03437 family)
MTLRTTLLLLIACGCLLADNVTYQYDDAGRLISATYASGAVVTFAYDRAGNLLARTVVAAGAPQIKSGGVVNSASYTAPLVRGELATIFGTGLAGGTANAGSLPLPATLGGVQVKVGGVPAPLYYVSPTQINFQVPFEAPVRGTAAVVVTRDGVPGSAEPVTLAEYAAGVFAYARTATVLDPIIVHATDNTLITPASPAVAGEALVIYATGVGSFDNPPASGAAAPSSPVAQSKVTPTVTIGGAPASVLFAGLTPGNVGLVQINVVLPATLPGSGVLSLAISFGTSSAAPVNLYVK